MSSHPLLAAACSREPPPTRTAAQAETQVEAAPAVQQDDVVLSYAELDARANQLAHHLLRYGAGPEELIALALPRDVGLLVAMLAVVKTRAHLLVHQGRARRLFDREPGATARCSTASPKLARRASNC